MLDFFQRRCFYLTQTLDGKGKIRNCTAIYEASLVSATTPWFAIVLYIAAEQIDSAEFHGLLRDALSSYDNLCFIDDVLYLLCLLCFVLLAGLVTWLYLHCNLLNSYLLSFSRVTSSFIVPTLCDIILFRQKMLRY